VSSWLERRGGRRRSILTQRHTQHDFGNSMWCGGGASQQQQAGKPYSFGWLAALLAGGGLCCGGCCYSTQGGSVGAPASGQVQVLWGDVACHTVQCSVWQRRAPRSGPRWTGASHVSGWCSGRVVCRSWSWSPDLASVVGGTLASGCISGGAAAAAERVSQSAAARSESCGNARACGVCCCRCRLCA
jgi:hypothetical protein